LSIRSE
jgi:hypothetical protein